MPFRAYNDPMNDLKNRVALVTGASRGIGAGIAVALAKVGADVAVNYRQRVDAAKSIRDEITRMGRKAIAVQADVSISSDVKRMVAESEAQLGPIDILVNNAAIAHPRKFEDITEFEWDEMLTVNLKSVFLVTKPLSEGCDNGGGPHHQPVFGRSTNGWCCGSALRCIEGRTHWTHTFLRLILRQSWHHRQRHRSCAD
jgi:NAD(P)-dependent dehydrogenase (short-subunit alcohol dehydrogenase family)